MVAFGRRLASLLVLLALVAGITLPAAHASVHAHQRQIHSARSHTDGLARPDAADDLGCSLVKAPISDCTVVRAAQYRAQPPRPTPAVAQPDHAPAKQGVDPVAPTRGPPSQRA